HGRRHRADDHRRGAAAGQSDGLRRGSRLMSDLLSLFRTGKHLAASQRTTTPVPVSAVAPAPVRSGAPPAIGTGTNYEVVVPTPSPIISMPSESTFFPPGSAGPASGPGNDTEGLWFTESTDPNPPASPPPLFYVKGATTNTK